MGKEYSAPAFAGSIAPGMSQRDFLAAVALHAFLSHSGALVDFKGVSEHAYAVADAMLKAEKI